jgi:hypothetical protein
MPGKSFGLNPYQGESHARDQTAWNPRGDPDDNLYRHLSLRLSAGIFPLWRRLLSRSLTIRHHRGETAMRKAIVIGLATTMTAIAVPVAAYYATMPSDDRLGEILREYDFVPITPPSNLMTVGSLYYVDAQVKHFKAICHAQKTDLEGHLIVSRSWEMQEKLERNGRLATGIKVDFGWLLKVDGEDNYVQKVHASLTDVVLEEIPLGPNWLIFGKLMEKPECLRVAMEHIDAGGYVCQGQKILQATAEYKLDIDARRKLATEAKATADDINSVVKRAIETQSDQTVVDQSGRLFAGTALKYGVSMNPNCLAPPAGRFTRTLPRTRLGRIVNFVKFRIVEPFLPAKTEESQVAHSLHGA